MALALKRPYRRTAAERATDGEAAPARPARGRVVAARGAWAVGSVMVAIARLVRLIATIVALILVAAIVLRLTGANASNSIVHDVHSVGSTLAGPFKGIFTFKSPKSTLAVNWGLAAVVYFIVGGMIARLITRMAPAGVHPSRAVV